MQPFLKWAGGKRWLFTPDFCSTLPRFERYVEPFLGGAAGFFALEPARALLSDANNDLIETYRAVRDFPDEVSTLLKWHQSVHSDTHYYEVRGDLSGGQVEKAARFLYLNRTCWNGLYRVNRLGVFNVPKGTKTAIDLATDDFQRVSGLLSKARLEVKDFECIINECGGGDLIFADPPYTVKHNMNGFVKYNEKIFAWSDQIRLCNSLLGAVSRGAKVILTNADHDSVRELYKGRGVIDKVSRRSIISGQAKGRAKVTEVVVRL